MTSGGADSERRVVRPATGTVWLVIAAALSVFLLGDALIRGRWADAVLIAPWLLLVVWFVYVFLFAPHVAVEDRRVRVQNPLRLVDVPFEAIDAVTVRWQLELRLTDGRIVQCWGVPARRSARNRKDPQSAEREAELLRERIGLDPDGVAASGSDAGGARVRWDLPLLAALAVIAVWAAAAIIVVQTGA